FALTDAHVVDVGGRAPTLGEDAIDDPAVTTVVVDEIRFLTGVGVGPVEPVLRPRRDGGNLHTSPATDERVREVRREHLVAQDVLLGGRTQVELDERVRIPYAEP